MNPLRKTILLPALAILLAGCGPRQAPEVITLTFWQAIKAGDFEAAAEQCSGADAEGIARAMGERVFERVEVGETLRSESSARVATELADARGDALQFDTRLERSDAGWRVSLEQTTEELRSASIGAAFGELDEALREGRRVIAEAIERGAREASRALRQAQEEIDELYPPEPEGPEAP